MMKWALIAGSVVVALGLGAELVARQVADAEFIQDRLAQQLGPGDASVTLRDATFSLLRRRVEAVGLQVRRPGALTVSAERIVATGIPLGGDAGAVRRVGSLDVRGLFFYLHPRADATDSTDATDAAAAQDAAASPDSAASWDSAPSSDSAALHVGELLVRDGTALAWRVDATDGPRQVVIRDLRVAGSGLTFGRSGRIVGSSRLEWTTGPFLRTRADGLTFTAMDSIRASKRDSTFVAHGIRYGPVHDDVEFFRRIEKREDRIRATIPRVELRGLDFEALARRGLVMRQASFEDFDVDVLSNKRIPSGPPKDPLLPRTLIERLEGPVRIDSTFLTGRIVYSELPIREVAAPARFAFEEFRCVVTGISKDPGDEALVVDASMSTFGAPARIRLDIPPDSQQFVMRMEGRVGAVSLPRLNSLTVPLRGMEIQDGRLEGLRFDITVEGPAAGGTVWVAYRDLDVQIVDSRTGEGGILDDIKSFVANTFSLRDENMPEGDEGGGADPGVVEYYFRPTDPFFTRVWAPIRSGLMEVAKK